MSVEHIMELKERFDNGEITFDVLIAIVREDAIDDFIKLFDATWETDTSESWVTFVHRLADKVKKGE